LRSTRVCRWFKLCGSRTLRDFPSFEVSKLVVWGKRRRSGNHSFSFLFFFFFFFFNLFSTQPQSSFLPFVNMSKYGLRALSIMDGNYGSYDSEDLRVPDMFPLSQDTVPRPSHSLSGLDSLLWLLSSGGLPIPRMVDEAVAQLKVKAVGRIDKKTLPVLAAYEVHRMFVQTDFRLEPRRVEFLRMLLKRLRGEVLFHEGTLVEGLCGHLLSETSKQHRAEMLRKLWEFRVEGGEGIVEIKAVLLGMLEMMGEEQFVDELLGICEEELGLEDLQKQNGFFSGKEPLRIPCS